MKLEQVLPPRLRHRVAALHSFIVPLGKSRSNRGCGTPVGHRRRLPRS